MHIYDEEEELMARLEAYVLEGSHLGQITVVIATPEHRQMLRERLEVFQLHDSFLGLDAQFTLDRFMREGMPDPRLFDLAVGTLVRSRAANGLRAYGEMVALLWKAGNVEGTLALERLWNDLQSTVEFSLLCGYAGADFADRQGLAGICEAHSHVVPMAA